MLDKNACFGVKMCRYHCVMTRAKMANLHAMPSQEQQLTDHLLVSNRILVLDTTPVPEWAEMQTQMLDVELISKWAPGHVLVDSDAIVLEIMDHLSRKSRFQIMSAMTMIQLVLMAYALIAVYLQLL